jgi:hypothetical protein
MRGLGVMAGVIGFLCMVMGILALFGVLPDAMIAKLPTEFNWTVWFWLSALLFLANIACIAGGRGRRGGGGEEF